jgi:hypothetical protein
MLAEERGLGAGDAPYLQELSADHHRLGTGRTGQGGVLEVAARPLPGPEQSDRGLNGVRHQAFNCLTDRSAPGWPAILALGEHVDAGPLLKIERLQDRGASRSCSAVIRPSR